MTRQELFDWVQQQYGTAPEYPWHDWNADSTEETRQKISHLLRQMAMVVFISENHSGALVYADYIRLLTWC